MSSRISNHKKQKLAIKLRNDMPWSERWFWLQWRRADMCHTGDKSNEVFRGFIPDVINHKFKYIIEIDGSIHNTQQQQEIDQLKNHVFRKAGYKVFRLKPFNNPLFWNLVRKIEELKNQQDFKPHRMIKKPYKKIKKRASKIKQCKKKAKVIDEIIKKLETTDG